MRNLLCAGLFASLSIAAIGHGQTASHPSIQALDFLSGRWVSETPTELQEETWTPVRGDSLTGSFRVVQSGKAVFYEFWAVEVEDDRPVLKLKHFGADLVGWEEKGVSTKMPLVSTAKGDALFAEADGSVSLHYHRDGDKLTCIVHHVKDGKSSDESFSLMRVAGS